MTRLTLELGGSCPMLVSRHADLDLAAAGAVRRSFRNAGQICIAINRIYVERPVIGDFVERVAELTRGLTVADGYANPGADVGPVTMEEILARTTAHVADARERGASVVAGAEPHAAGGLFLAPAVVVDAPHDAKIMTEETFGPAVGRHARRLAGRGGAARQRRAGRPRRLPVHRGARRDHAAQQPRWTSATSPVNNVDAGIINAPYGGRRESGFGSEHGREGLEGYLQLKHVRIRHTH